LVVKLPQVPKTKSAILSPGHPGADPALAHPSDEPKGLSNSSTRPLPWSSTYTLLLESIATPAGAKSWLSESPEVPLVGLV
jgi:hypothetical protein